jgi:ATP/maltotriose-dependent transcriptional regulator MalT
LANGWPAVIGLAGVSSAEIEENLDQVPESLYRFFADEVFTSLSGDVQQGITTLSVAPALTRELAGALLGAHSNAVVDGALDVGILVERDARLDLHPLARAFLKERVGRLGLVPAQGAVETCITHYRLRGEWDAAFETAAGNASVDDLEALMHQALAELIDTGRLQTVETWNNVASDRGLSAPIFLLSRGLVALRLGRPIEAMSTAQAAAERDPGLAYRAMSIAGTAAHLASREEDAFAFFGRAAAAKAVMLLVLSWKWRG